MFGLDSVSDATAHFLKARRIDEEEVSLEGHAVDFDRTLYINFDDRDLSFSLDPLEFVVACAVVAAIWALPILNKFLCCYFPLELCLADEVKILRSLFIAWSPLARCVRLLSIEDVAILGENQINEREFANARRTHEDQRLILERCRVEGMEVLFREDKNVVLTQIAPLSDCVAHLLACGGGPTRGSR